MIAAGEGAITVKVETRPLTTEPAFWPAQPLHEAEGPFSVSMVNETLEEIGGEAFEVSSRSGRPVPARYVRGTDHPIMLSGGQHPNEISGVAGALRGASLLSEREGAHFTVSPLENPDGYALHYALCQSQPHQMATPDASLQAGDHRLPPHTCHLIPPCAGRYRSGNSAFPR